MSRLIIISSILATIIVLSIISLFYLNSTNEQIEVIVAEIIQSCNEQNENITLEKAGKLSSFWKERERVLKFFIRSDDLDMVAGLLVDLTAYAHTKSFASVYVEANRILGTIGHMYERQIPNVRNLF